MRPSVLLLALAACGGTAAPEAPTHAPEAAGAAVTAPEAPAAPAIGAFEAVSAEGARVFFVEPADGATVTGPFTVTFGVEAVEVRAAGDLVANTGHHHLLVDTGPVALGETVPKDEHHVHYGKGETTTTLDLPPGEHTLTMQLADGAHRSYGDALSATVRVTVVEPTEGAATP